VTDHSIGADSAESVLNWHSGRVTGKWEVTARWAKIRQRSELATTQELANSAIDNYRKNFS
jgi:hypothetical protein